jgi:hypothetical protein
MLKNLKSLFVVTEETPPQATGSTPSATASNAAIPVEQRPVSETTASGELDEAILEKLLKAFEDNNQPGFDYFEFRQSLKAMAHIPLDEATKYQTVFATASAMGITQEKLLSSIQFYQKVLKKEEDTFQKATDDQRQRAVESKKAEQEALRKSIAEKSELIQKLSSEIHQHQKTLEELLQSVTEAEQRINTTQAKFQATLQFVGRQLDDDIVKLKTYIK